MTPVYLNPQNSSSIPFLELKGDQQHSFQVFGHVHDYDLASSSNNSCLSYNNSFNSHSSQETLSFDYSRHDSHSKVEKLILSHENTSDLVQPWLQNIVEDNGGDSNVYNYEDRNNNKKLSSSKKWKPSKMKIVQKTVGTSSNNKNSAKLNNNKQVDHHLNKQHRHSNGETIRVCSDCHTTTTPLWRSGPQGPKTLCNACGIRQRKARRAAMAAAAAEVITSPISSSLMDPPQKSANKAIEVKAERGFLSHTLPIKKRSKIIDAAKNIDHTQNSHSAKTNFGFEDFATSSNNDYFDSSPKRSFPRDEEEGAILLMALSCGLACSS